MTQLRPSKHAAPCPRSDERGTALVFVLLAFVVLSVAAASFMMLTNVETKLAGHDMRRSASLNIAEAGIAEAVARMRVGDIPDNGNPRMVAQIFLTDPGSVPVLGPDSIALATKQPVGQWLSYSMPQRDRRVLEVRYKTDAARTQIYRYDPTKSPPVQTSTGMPIFVVSSTGRKGMDTRHVENEVCMKPFTVYAKAALACDQGIDFSGSSFTCGYNHRPTTPAWTEGRGPCLAYEVGTTDKPGAWSSSTITSAGAGLQWGVPSATLQNQTGFFGGPWDVFGMTRNEFFGWIGNPIPTAPVVPKGLLYIDGNTTWQDVSTDVHYPGGNGEGFLYIDGNFEINGNFTYRGLIYVEGDLKINGNTWILGGIIVKGMTRIKIATGDCAILYSEDTIKQKLSRYGGEVLSLSWLETDQ